MADLLDALPGQELWLERKQRTRRWYAAEEAAALVQEDDTITPQAMKNPLGQGRSGR